MSIFRKLTALVAAAMFVANVCFAAVVGDVVTFTANGQTVTGTVTAVKDGTLTVTATQGTYKGVDFKLTPAADGTYTVASTAATTTATGAAAVGGAVTTGAALTAAGLLIGMVAIVNQGNGTTGHHATATHH